MNIKSFQAITGIASASGAQLVLLATLSLLLAKALTVEDFGITRVVTAYVIILTMLGHFCLHDAVSTFVARSETDDEKSSYIVGGSYLVLFISIAVAALFEILILSSALWTGQLKTALATVVLFLPVIALAIVYTSVLQSIGSYTKLAFAVVLGGAVPLLLIVPAATAWELPGWIAGRSLSYVILLACGMMLIRNFLRPIKPPAEVYGKLMVFGRVQVVSGILSMIMQSADIIALERFGGTMSDIALYGLAALFSRSVLFLPGALGRVFFREIAEGATQGVSWKPIAQLLMTVAGLCIALTVAMVIVVPTLIETLYSRDYAASIPILRVMCLGIVFNGMWAALSVINVAINKPHFAVVISLIGASTSIALLLILVPHYGAIGAAWAMNAAYIAGSSVGLWLIYMENRRRTVVKTLRGIEID